MIKQYRWFGEGHALNTINATVKAFGDGTLFNDLNNKNILYFGIQALPGTTLYLSSEPLEENSTIDNVDNSKKLIINNTGIYQINFINSDITFNLGALAVKIIDDIDYTNYGIIIDVIYKEG